MKSFIPLVATLAFAVTGAVPVPQFNTLPFGIPPNPSLHMPSFGGPPPPPSDMPSFPFNMPQIMPPNPFGGIPPMQMPPNPFGGMPQMQMPPNPFGGMNLPPWMIQLLMTNVLVNRTQDANMSILPVGTPEESLPADPDTVGAGATRQFSGFPSLPSIGQNFPFPSPPDALPNLPFGQNFPIPQINLPSGPGSTPSMNDMLYFMIQMVMNGGSLPPVPSVP